MNQITIAEIDKEVGNVRFSPGASPAMTPESARSLRMFEASLVTRLLLGSASKEVSAALEPTPASVLPAAAELNDLSSRTDAAEDLKFLVELFWTMRLNTKFGL